MIIVITGCYGNTRQGSQLTPTVVLFLALQGYSVLLGEQSLEGQACTFS